MHLGSVLLLISLPVHALTVCADPDYLPYSNRAGEGFENKIAGAVAKALVGKEHAGKIYELNGPEALTTIA